MSGRVASEGLRNNAPTRFVPPDDVSSDRGSAPAPLPDPNGLEDAELVAKLIAGGQDALTRLFEKYASSVFRVARRVLNDRGEAEETVQDVFLDLFKAIRQFDRQKGAFKPWLLGFAYKRALKQREHLQTRRVYTNRQIGDLPPQDLVDKTVQRFRLACQETPHLAQEFLGMLKTSQRRIVELSVFQGFTYEEVAKATGKSLSVIRNTLHRSIDKLRSAAQREAFRGKKER